ncbi:7-carboxy-7-deazaguanine synthase QueE [Coraliomargarita parva]|uniref:7-carboxy-7-deazaguanine synthase QueE n=1 Tax=Coraliomargarita parva TaxID=3014050 RepID=UPI0022B3E472|nr:7-carboxy-7-deazaguanine synthase QueE [Coraliomargarita parva]
MKLPIHERFYTFQGEGSHAGRAAFFIRCFGCPVHCPWCDSAGTWHPDYIPEQIARLEVEALADEAAHTKAEFVVVTGGEPAIHDLAPLCDALHARKLPVHLETSGAFPIRGDFDWITLSPKRWKLPLAENLQKASEFKLIIDRTDALEEYREVIRDASTGTSDQRSVWLHPEWSQHGNAELLSHITEWIKAHGAPFRAGWQMHKNYAADLNDPRSAPPAPLGGDSQKGY